MAIGRKTHWLHWLTDSLSDYYQGRNTIHERLKYIKTGADIVSCDYSSIHTVPTIRFYEGLTQQDQS